MVTTALRFGRPPSSPFFVAAAVTWHMNPSVLSHLFPSHMPGDDRKKQQPERKRQCVTKVWRSFPARGLLCHVAAASGGKAVLRLVSCASQV